MCDILYDIYYQNPLPTLIDITQIGADYYGENSVKILPDDIFFRYDSTIYLIPLCGGLCVLPTDARYQGGSLPVPLSQEYVYCEYMLHSSLYDYTKVYRVVV
jgi:hypothetical protein